MRSVLFSRQCVLNMFLLGSPYKIAVYLYESLFLGQHTSQINIQPDFSLTNSLLFVVVQIHMYIELAGLTTYYKLLFQSQCSF